MAVKVFPWRLSSAGVYVANFDTAYVRHEQDFQVGDIFTLMGGIAALSGWDSEKKLVINRVTITDQQSLIYQQTSPLSIFPLPFQK